MGKENLPPISQREIRRGLNSQSIEAHDSTTIEKIAGRRSSEYLPNCLATKNAIPINKIVENIK
jgi:hypothetical protein